MRQGRIQIIGHRSLLAVALLLAWCGPSQSAPKLELVVDSQLDFVQADWRPWLERVALVVATIGDGFPVPEVKVVLHPNEGSDPIGSGWIRRNSPPEVHLRISPEASLSELLDDWHAYHEFAHLLLPFPGNRDIWFAEGLASYYQYFLQARAGVIDADEAWRRLVAGFQRGFDDPAGKGEQLAELSPRMWRLRAFRRVYWSGAAFFLRVDHRLRVATRNEQSLDSTLAAFAKCCMQDGSRRWTAQTLVEQLGKLSVPAIWHEEYQRVIESAASPEFGNVARALGLEADREGVRLMDDTAGQRLRQALAMGTPYPDLDR